METFGRKLKELLERRGLRIEDVAQASGLYVAHIKALQRDDFSALPDDEVVTKGLRAFARLVDVDADQVIADFIRERQRSAPRMEPEPSKPAGRRSVGVAIPVLIILACAAVSFLYWPRASSVHPSGLATAAAQARTPPPAAPAAVEAPPADSEAPPEETPVLPPESREPEPAMEPPIDAPGVRVPAHGVGRGITGHDLVGETRRFAEGERVYFWTRIEGGAAGEKIDHVWIHEGEEALRVPIRLGGTRWRANSYKLLNAGSAGDWVVEARDRSGRVLARREFSCSRGGATHPHM